MKNFYFFLFLLFSSISLTAQMQLPIDGQCPSGTYLYYFDQDGDGYGNPLQPVCSTLRPVDASANNLDCNDNNSLIHPGAVEVADGKDNDCDGLIDEGVVPLLPVAPVAESFESGFGQWSTGTATVDWSRKSGSTGSSGTGPTGAKDGTYYIYMEASNNFNKSSALTSPVLRIAVGSHLSFGYHMYGLDMGNLKVQVSTNQGSSWTQLWSISGDQGSSWKTAEIDLSSYGGNDIKLRFYGTTGANYRSDIAIDDIKFIAGSGGGAVNFSDENYIFTRVYKNKLTSSPSNPTVEDVIEEITYFDGLGRPMQHIGIKQAGGDEYEDIVTHIGYDEYGRENKKYLPHPDVGNTPGLYKTGNNVLNTQNYYKANYGSDFLNISTASTNPYSETHFEASPLNRPVEQGAPGTAWAVNKSSDADHTVKFNYGTNVGSAETGKVRLFNVSLSSTYNPTLTNPSPYYYAAGELYKTVTKDENWTSGLNNTVEEFKDKQGRVVLKRTYNAGAAHDTYYVYDDYGNLTYVIPPKADATTTTVAGNTTKLNELCYQYKYDHRNRLIEKKIPGKGWEYIVYNKLDQPILTKDANLTGKWLYTKYDAFGRVIATGLHTNSASSQSAMQGIVNNHYSGTTKAWEEKTTSNTYDYYTNHSYPTSSYETLTLNYYDNYTFNHANLKLAAGTVIFDDNVEYTTKGLATGSKVKVLDQNKWITTVNHYNKEGRVIYSASYNDFLNTTDKVKNQLDFMGVVLKTESRHKKGTNAEIVTTDNFTYDHVNRLVKHTQTLNGKTEVIAANIYDKLGQLKSKEVGNEEGKSRLQTVDYTYNVRGWLKQINNPATLGTDLFGFKLNYNTVGHSGTPLFNGNIAETEWKTGNDNVLRWYRYGYDHLNRIASATANSSNYNVSGIMYDKNGNITNLTRRGAINSTSSSFGEMDKLSYFYDSDNKLRIVSDAGNDTYGFKDDYIGTSTDTSTDYTYDGNGNMLTDSNKGITGIVYNHLNLPKSVSIGGGTITYIYDATGVKQRKVAGTTTTDYAGNYMYKNNVLQFFSHPEGYVENNAGTYKYHYQYKDHLGNIRLSYFNNGTASSPSVVISEENNYYPFGLRHKGYNDAPNGYGNSAAKMFKFGGKELQDEVFGGKNLDWYDFHARNYDAALGRWMNVDPLAEKFYDWSPYNYTYNNPLKFIDPTGMGPETIYEDELGNTLANTNDGNDATVVISNENREAFQEDFNNTSVMFRDGSKKNGEWIEKYGEGMVAEEGAAVQSWAVEAMGHNSNYNGLTLSATGLGLALGEEAMEGKSFRLFNNKSTNFSPKLYSSGWKGGSAGQIKTYGGGSKVLGFAGRALGWYAIGNTMNDLNKGNIGTVEGTADMVYGLVGVLGGTAGGVISLSYELGKIAGPSKWYGNDNTKWFE